ncbi:MAG: CoA transferase subunit A [Anaerolineales bacterium]|nr:CoA transferase subunit A [Anaerolineales bacterium]
MKTADFVEARRRLGEKSLKTTEKLTTLAKAVNLVRDGDHVAFGGCMFTRTPLALAMEILRQGRTGLTISKNLMCYEGEWFMAVDAAQNVITSWLGIGLPWGISRILREKGESGQLRLEDWSHMGLGMRYRAGAMGLPFLPTLTMLGSGLAEVTETRSMACPFTGQTLNLVPALFPDVALLHVHRADRYGNCQIDGYPFMDADIAAASTTVLVTAEEIVDEDEIRRHPDRTAIPGFMVDAVAHVPYGAYPHEMHGLYVADYAHYDTYVDAIKARGTGAIREYLDRFVYGAASHEAYLALFDGEVLKRNEQDAKELLG